MDDVKANKFRDLLFNQSGAAVRAAAFGTLGRASVQPEQLVASLGLLMLLICKKYKVRVPDVMEMAARVYNDGEKYGDVANHHFALCNYVANELPDVR